MKKFVFGVAVTLILVAVSCGRNGSKISAGLSPSPAYISVKNTTSNAMWVELLWSGPDVPVGILGPDMFKTTAGENWPTNVESAKLKLIDDETKNTHSVDVSLTGVSQQLSTNQSKFVTIRILSWEKADVIFSEPY